MNMKAFLSQSHVLVSPEGDTPGMVDEALAQLGKHRNLVLTLPQMFVASAVVAQTDMTATVMKRVALNSSARRILILFPPPVLLPEIVFDLIWHRRNDSHPAQIWLRALVDSVAKSL